MKHEDFKKLVRSEIHRMFEADGYPIALKGVESSFTPGPVSGGQSKLAGIPGAPNGGNLLAADIHALPAEAKEALTKWAKIAKLSLQKYGDVLNWPPLVKEALEKLGREYDLKVQPAPSSGQRGPSTTSDSPASQRGYP